MRTRRLDYFVTLASEDSYVKAAEKLFISQPGLSQQIKLLEQELGVNLIDRTVRPWRITPIGKAVLVHARVILDGVKGLNTLLHGAQTGKAGGLRLGVVQAVLLGRLPRMLRDYKQQNPQVSISITPGNTTTLIELLEESKIDVIAVLGDCGSDEIASVPLYEQDMMLVLPSGHPLAGKSSVRLRDVRDETICMTARINSAIDHDRIIAACVEEGFSPKTYLQIGSYTHQVGLVAAGMGVAIVPEEMSSYSRDEVVFKRLDKLSLPVVTTLAWRKDNTDPVCREFLRAQKAVADKERGLQGTPTGSG